MHQQFSAGSITERSRLCEQLGVDETVTTAQAAKLLNVHPVTLYNWAAARSGPIQPRRVGRSLHWSVADIRAVLNGTAAAAT